MKYIVASYTLLFIGAVYYLFNQDQVWVLQVAAFPGVVCFLYCAFLTFHDALTAAHALLDAQDQASEPSSESPQS